MRRSNLFTPTFEIHTTGRAWVDGSCRMATHEDAKAFAATFPKSWGVKATTLAGDDEHKGIVVFHVQLHADGVNKGVNERGLWRLRKILGRVAWALHQGISNVENGITTEPMTRDDLVALLEA